MFNSVMPSRVVRKSHPVQILPKNDAMLNELANVLGITEKQLIELVDGDPSEISQRQDVVTYIRRNRSRFATWYKSSREYGYDTLPGEGEDFLRYSEALTSKETRFWKLWQGFLSSVTGNDVPERLLQLLAEVQARADQEYAFEQALVADIVQEMRKAMHIAGVIRIWVDGHDLLSFERGFSSLNSKLANNALRYEQLACVGVMPYHKVLDTPFAPTVPSKWSWKFGAYWAKRKDRKRLAERNRTVQFARMPLCLLQDILGHVHDALRPLNYEVRQAVSKLTFDVGYWFEAGKLNIRFLDFGIDPQNQTYEGCDPVVNFGPHMDENSGKHFGETFRSCYADGKKLECQTRIHQALQLLPQVLKGLDARNTFKEYGIPNFSKIIARFEERRNHVRQWQAAVEASCGDVLLLTRLLLKMEEYQLPMALPEIVHDRNLLELQGVYPIRLAGHRKDIHPFGEFSVNGRMVNFTGRNGSGKSTALMAALDAQLLGQCGLPVFAEAVRLSVKTAFLLSYLERSSVQSTFVVKLSKDKQIVDTVSRMSDAERSATLAIIDELGGGTTQDSVLEVAKPFVRWLSDKQISVMVSTQIPVLSEYIGSDLHGINLRIGTDYGIAEGIGEGEPGILAESMGFFDSLKK